MSGRKRRVAGGRYDERLIAARIEQRRRQFGIPVKDLVERVGMSQSDYSR